MENSRQVRVLGAARTLSDAVSQSFNGTPIRHLLRKVDAKVYDDLSLNDLEQIISIFSNHNSNYTNVETDDFHTLVDEVLNNSIRSLLIYADFSNHFGDAEILSLSMGLQYNLSIEAVTLSGINVSDEAISTMCEALAQSRVTYINLSNTPLQDDAGTSIAALAHVNPYLRTVIVDETLISDDILDEIDVACQFNQSNFEGNNGAIDEALFRPTDLSRLKQRLIQIIRAHQNHIRFCVAHLFGCCPNAELCLYSHALGTSGVDDTKGSLSDKIAELFALGGKWEEKLPPRPQAGASWRDPEEAKNHRPRLNMDRRREFKKHIKEGKKVRKESLFGINVRLSTSVSVALSAITALCLLGFFLRFRKRSST